MDAAIDDSLLCDERLQAEGVDASAGGTVKDVELRKLMDVDILEPFARSRP
jgi:hypothetical protein